MRSSHSTRRRGGFTLVELLVVIGIIALLISILLPSLNNARKAALKVKCQANLHNIGNALLNYSAANRGRLPSIGFTKAPWQGAAWLWDVPIPMRDAMVKAGATRQTFYCPAAPDNSMQMADYVWTYHDPDFSNDKIATFLRSRTDADRDNGISILGYVCLILRPWSPSGMAAPGITYGSSPNAANTMQDPGNPPTVYGDPNWNLKARTWKYQKSIVPDNKGCVVIVSAAGPSFQKSNSSSETEIFADAIGTNGTSNNFGIIQGGLPVATGLYQGSSHMAKNSLPSGANVLFLDGHVSWRPFNNGSTYNPTVGGAVQPADYFNQDVVHYRASIGDRLNPTTGGNVHWFF